MSRRKQRSTLIKVNPDGTIKERYRVLVEDGFDPRDGYIELVGDKDKNLASRPIRDLLYRGGKLQEKPVVNVVMNKAVIEADGKDEAEITLVGVPKDMKEVNLKIGNQVHKVDPREKFAVNTTHAQQITIGVTDRTVKVNPVYLRGVKKRSKLNET